MTRAALLLSVFLSAARAQATLPPLQQATNATGPGKWMKCYGSQIAKCASCVAEDAALALATVLVAAKRSPFQEDSVGKLLQYTIKGALQCVNDCHMPTQELVRECGTSWYCKTDFCVVCCGPGSWQCMGNDWTPQCAPKKTVAENVLEDAQKFSEDVEKSVNNFVDSAGDSVEDVVMNVADNADGRLGEVLAQPANSMEPLNVTGSTGIEKCRCGAGSGDPDSCCSKCQPSSDKHNVPHCPGGGKNTGPFCGNDFHVTEPNACYGDTPICCTNDLGMPVCCKKDQVCYSPPIGDNRCMGPLDTIVV